MKITQRKYGGGMFELRPNTKQMVFEIIVK